MEKTKEENEAWIRGYEAALKHVKSLNWIKRLLMPFFE
jgi:hypothetical protein